MNVKDRIVEKNKGRSLFSEYQREMTEGQNERERKSHAESKREKSRSVRKGEEEVKGKRKFEKNGKK